MEKTLCKHEENTMKPRRKRENKEITLRKHKENIMRT